MTGRVAGVAHNIGVVGQEITRYAHPENRVKAKTELIYWEVTSAVGGERWTREV